MGIKGFTQLLRLSECGFYVKVKVCVTRREGVTVHACLYAFVWFEV